MSIIKKWVLRCTTGGHNKEYQVLIEAENSFSFKVYALFGKIGSRLNETKPRTYTNFGAAVDEAEKMVRMKTRPRSGKEPYDVLVETKHSKAAVPDTNPAEPDTNSSDEFDVTNVFNMDLLYPALSLSEVL